MKAIDLLRKYVDISHHYEAEGKRYVHFRCVNTSGQTDEVMLKFIIGVAEASNNPVMIQVDERGFYYTLIIHHNADIIEHHLE